MKIELPLTYFDPPERADSKLLSLQFESLNQTPLIRSLIDGMPDLVVILNRQRQIVLANDKVADLLGSSVERLIGMRFGEAIHCDHAGDEPADAAPLASVILAAPQKRSITPGPW